MLLCSAVALREVFSVGVGNRGANINCCQTIVPDTPGDQFIPASRGIEGPLPVLTDEKRYSAAPQSEVFVEIGKANDIQPQPSIRPSASSPPTSDPQLNLTV